jgi:hypothetical protein
VEHFIYAGLDSCSVNLVNSEKICAPPIAHTTDVSRPSSPFSSVPLELLFDIVQWSLSHQRYARVKHCDLLGMGTGYTTRNKAWRRQGLLCWTSYELSLSLVEPSHKLNKSWRMKSFYGFPITSYAFYSEEVLNITLHCKPYFLRNQVQMIGMPHQINVI